MARIVIANGLDKNSITPMEVGLSWGAKLNKEPLVLHGDKLADYETLDSVFAHLNLEVHQNYVQSILEANNAALNRQLDKINSPIKNIQCESRSGNPAEVLLTEVEKDETELIVLGHDTDKGLAELFLGGVTESIIHKSKKSVLIAKDEKAGSPKKVVVAYDFSYHCDEAIDWAKNVAKAYGAEINLVNVVPCYYQGYHVAHTLHNGFNAALEEMIDESVAEIEKKLAKKVEEIKGEGFNVSSKAILDKDGSISDKLVEHLKSENADLLIMGTHARGKVAELFLGSVAGKMIKKSPTSVLIAK
jgi:universal stress protein A